MSPESRSGITSLPRSLTPRELAVVTAMIQRSRIDESHRTRWLERLPWLQVVASCNCGQCPSIVFQQHPRPGDRHFVEALTGSVSLLLVVDHDIPTELELTDFAGGSHQEFPPPEHLSLITSRSDTTTPTHKP